MNRIYYWAKNFQDIADVINELSENERFIIPKFLLRAQLVEFALKYLLTHAPYKPSKGLGKKPVEEMTMGEVIKKLRECQESHFDKIIEAAEDFKELRNEVTHRLLTTDKTVFEIEQLILDKFDVADNIENQIVRFANFVEHALSVNFEEIS